MVLSAVNVTVLNNTFLNLHAANILFLEGGCGAYEDYTEGTACVCVCLCKRESVCKRECVFV